MPKSFFSREQYIELFVPDNAVQVAEGSGLAVVYTYINAGGRPAATAFVRKQAKPAWTCWFPSVERREAAIAKLFSSVRAHQERVEASRKEHNAGHRLQPGDIVFSSWGYDQTNVDWYRVNRATDHYVWLAPLASVETEENLAMSGHCVPGVDLGKPERKCKAHGEQVTIGRYSGSRWDGRPRYFSTYA